MIRNMGLADGLKAIRTGFFPQRRDSSDDLFLFHTERIHFLRQCRHEQIQRLE